MLVTFGFTDAATNGHSSDYWDHSKVVMVRQASQQYHGMLWILLHLLGEVLLSYPFIQLTNIQPHSGKKIDIFIVKDTNCSPQLWSGDAVN